jgi:hypothetical protein
MAGGVAPAYARACEPAFGLQAAGFGSGAGRRVAARVAELKDARRTRGGAPYLAGDSSRRLDDLAALDVLEDCGHEVRYRLFERGERVLDLPQGSVRVAHGV